MGNATRVDADLEDIMEEKNMWSNKLEIFRFDRANAVDMISEERAIHRLNVAKKNVEILTYQIGVYGQHPTREIKRALLAQKIELELLNIVLSRFQGDQTGVATHTTFLATLRESLQNTGDIQSQAVASLPPPLSSFDPWTAALINKPSPGTGGDPASLGDQYPDDFLKFLQSKGGLRPDRFRHVHQEVERDIPLVHRQDILLSIQTCWQKRRENLSAVTIENDRNLYPFPICLGIPGVGKTRLLEEWERVFNAMGVSKIRRLGLLVVYHNGHATQKVEEGFPITMTFAWRMIHRYFFEGITHFNVFMLILPYLPRQLTIVDAIRLILEAEGIDIDSRGLSDEPFSFYLGVDEFQAIHHDNWEPLLSELLSVSQSFAVRKIYLYPLFAGTEFTRLIASNLTHCVKIKIPFLKNYDSIAAHLYPQMMTDAKFQSYLYTLGNVPRLIFEFSRLMQPNHSPAQMIANRKDVLDKFSNQWDELPRELLLRIVAYSVSGIPVDVREVLPDSQMTWQKLADRGLLEFSVVTNDLDEETRIIVPYAAVLKVTAKFRRISSSSPAEVRFIHSLKLLQDKLTSDGTQPWHCWELFGAHFHALRMNAFLILGFYDVPLEMLFPAARCNFGLDGIVSISLRPTQVITAEDPFSDSTELESIREGGRTMNTFNLESLDFCYVVCNGENGKGVDIFFLLPKVGGGYFLVLDQRKREAAALAKKKVRNYLDLMPSCKRADVTVIRCIFSSLAKIGPRFVDISPHTVLFSREELLLYHTSLAYHPFAQCRVNIHFANQSLLESVLCGIHKNTKVIAKGIMRLIQEKHPFLCFSDLVTKYQENFRVTLSPRLGSVLYFPQEEVHSHEVCDEEIDGEDETNNGFLISETAAKGPEGQVEKKKGTKRKNQEEDGAPKEHSDE